MEIMKKMSILKHRFLWQTLALAGFVLLMVSPCVTFAQYPDDTIPVLDYGRSQKAVTVRLHFTSPTMAALDSVDVFYGRAHGRAGAPPILDIELLDLNGTVIQEFGAWHPLTVYARDDDGHDQRMIRDSATGSIIFPFDPDIVSMTVKDEESQTGIISVDLPPLFHDFCRENPADEDCGQIVNRQPWCNAGGPYSVECTGQTTDVLLDGTGCSDSDGDPLTFAWSGSFTGGTAEGITPAVQFRNYGNFNVNLQVIDDFGGHASCSSSIAVVDTTPPVIQCNAPATIKPPDAPLTFNATAADGCVGDISANITGFDCFAFTKKGKRIDKKGSCSVDIEGDTITIHDSGGVNDHITWNISATDTDGNNATMECEMLVVKPGK